MIKQLILVLLVLITIKSQINPPAKLYWDACVQQIEQKRLESMQAVNSDEKKQIQDEMATFLKCRDNVTSQTGTIKEGTTQNPLCAQLHLNTNYDNLYIDIWRQQYFACHNYCNFDENEFQHQVNVDWNLGIKACRGMLLTSQAVKDLYFCMVDCLQTSFVQFFIQNKGDTQVLDKMYGQLYGSFMCNSLDLGEECLKFRALNDDWTHPNFLEYKNNCEGICFDKAGINFNTEAHWAKKQLCEEKCVTDYGSTIDWYKGPSLEKIAQNVAKEAESSSKLLNFCLYPLVLIMIFFFIN